MPERRRFVLGEIAGHHFRPDGSFLLARHVTCGTRKGYFVGRKWLADRKAFEYDPTLGWAKEHWFEWPDEPVGRSQ